MIEELALIKNKIMRFNLNYSDSDNLFKCKGYRALTQGNMSSFLENIKNGIEAQ